MSETFIKIWDYPRYEVSNLGTVRNRDTGRILKNSPDKKGYPRVMLTRPGNRMLFPVARLVAQAFLDPTLNRSHIIKYADGDNSNIEASNLIIAHRELPVGKQAKKLIVSDVMPGELLKPSGAIRIELCRRDLAHRSHSWRHPLFGPVYCIERNDS